MTFPPGRSPLLAIVSMIALLCAGCGDREESVADAARSAAGEVVRGADTPGDSTSALPDAETAAQFEIQTSLLGNVRTQTMRAFTEEEAANIVGALQ